jgi:hypothetical protein
VLDANGQQNDLSANRAVVPILPGKFLFPIEPDEKRMRAQQGLRQFHLVESALGSNHGRLFDEVQITVIPLGIPGKYDKIRSSQSRADAHAFATQAQGQDMGVGRLACHA